MMFRSFRFRLGLLSALISGLVVLAFGSVAWWSLARSNLEKLDTDMQHFGFRVALRTGRNVDTQRLESSLIELLGMKKADRRFFALLSSDQTPLFTSAGWPTGLTATDFPPSGDVLDPQPTDSYRRPTEHRGQPRVVFEPRFSTAEVSGAKYRIGVFSNADVVLVLGADLQEHVREMHRWRGAFLIALPGALLVVALGAAMVGWRAFRPVASLGRDMRNVSAQSLSHRLDLGGADQEFEVIIESYNAMLERLERSFHQANRFSADASHELKTPLAIMQGTLERALAESEDGSAAQRALIEVLEQTGRQRSILESLLLLSRADSGQLEVSRERLPFSDLLLTWTEDAEFLAEPRKMTVHRDIERNVWIEGDVVMWQQVAHNLFSNAVRYNREGGTMECNLRLDGAWVEWTVTNTGASIPLERREAIFERFVRIDPSGDDVGAGLGLSLVREIVEAHGGEIALLDSGEDQTRFRIRILSAV